MGTAGRWRSRRTPAECPGRTILLFEGFGAGVVRNFYRQTKKLVESVVVLAGRAESGRRFGGAGWLAVARNGCGGPAQRLRCDLRELVGGELEVADAGWRRVFAP